MQYGNGLTDSNGGINITFPISFSNTNYTILPTLGYLANPNPTGFKRTTKQRSSVRIGVNVTSDYSGIAMDWFAIGY